MVHRKMVHRKIFQSHSCLTVLKALGWLAKVVYRVFGLSSCKYHISCSPVLHEATWPAGSSRLALEVG